MHMKIKLSALSGGLRQEVKKCMNEGKVRISSFPKPIKESLLSEAKGEYPTVSYLKSDFSTVYGWQNKEVTFKRGTECERADNQPEDKNGAPFYWIREIPQDKLDDEEFVSWFDTYGFKISIDMVTPFSMKLMESSFDEVYVYKKTPKGKSPYPEVPMDSNPVKEASAILAKTVKSFNMDVNKAREAIFDLQRSGGFYIFNKLEPEERNEVKKIMKIYGMMGSEEIPLNENRMYQKQVTKT